MIRYLCDHCGTPFDEPVTRHYTETLGEFTRPYTEAVCPICGCDSFSDADLCPKCGEAKLAEETLCKRCRDALHSRIIDFADTLTAEEEAQLDDWMDGDSITSRRNWT